MSRSIWAILGVDRDAAAKEIRRAYSRKLKVTNPEDDPDGFQALRAAYEQALAWAGEGGGRRVAPMPPPPRPQEQERAVVAAGEFSDGPAWERSSDPDEAADDEPGFSAYDEPRQGVDRSLEFAFGRLSQLLAQQPSASPAALQLALDDILISPLLEQLGTYGRVEAWLADLIAYNIPESDPLVEIVVRRFGWGQAATGFNASPDIQVVVARQHDLASAARLKRPGGAHEKAFKILAAPRRKRFWDPLSRIWHAGDIDGLLNLIDHQHPTLARELDPETVAWWRQYLGRPRLTLRALLLLYGAPLLIALIGVMGRHEEKLSTLPVAIGYGGWALGATLILGFFGYVFAPLRERWLYDLSDHAGNWSRLGWAPAACVLMLLGAAIPPHPAVMGAMTVLSLGVVLWMALVRPAWPGRTTVVMLAQAGLINIWLGVWWLVAISGQTMGQGWLMSLPLLAAAIVFSEGLNALDDLWQSKGVADRRGPLLYAFAAALLVLGALIFLVPEDVPAYRVLLAAAVAAYLPGRILSLRWEREQTTLRVQIGIVLAVVAMVVAGAFQVPLSGAAVLLLLCTALANVMVTLAQDMGWSRKKARVRPKSF